MAPAQRVGAFILMAAPFVTLITRVPQSGLIMFLGGFLTLGMSSIIHLVTLPTEWDASFSRAMPMLESSNFLKEGDSDRAKEILRAAALSCWVTHESAEYSEMVDYSSSGSLIRLKLTRSPFLIFMRSDKPPFISKTQLIIPPEEIPFVE